MNLRGPVLVFCLFAPFASIAGAIESGVPAQPIVTRSDWNPPEVTVSGSGETLYMVQRTREAVLYSTERDGTPKNASPSHRVRWYLVTHMLSRDPKAQEKQLENPMFEEPANPKAFNGVGSFPYPSEPIHLGNTAVDTALTADGKATLMFTPDDGKNKGGQPRRSRGVYAWTGYRDQDPKWFCITPALWWGHGVTLEQVEAGCKSRSLSGNWGWNFSFVCKGTGAKIPECVREEEARRRIAVQYQYDYRVRSDAEKAPANHPWAGVYYNPGGFGPSHIDLAPSGRFCFGTFLDLGGGTSGYCGHLRLDGDRFVSDGATQTWSDDESDAPPFVQVVWGKRRYLVPESHLLDFVNDVNQCEEPRYKKTLQGSSFAFLRKGDETTLVTGMPAVPGRFRTLLRPDPIATTAVWISTDVRVIPRLYLGNECRHEVRFDEGETAGLFPGMVLYAQSDDLFHEAVIEDVSSGSARGFTRDDCDRKQGELWSGIRFGSRPKWNMAVVLSTEPLAVKVRFASQERFPPFYSGWPKPIFHEDDFRGANKTGFSWTKVADVSFIGSFAGALGLPQSESQIRRTILSLGGNFAMESEEGLAKQGESMGYAEVSNQSIYRVSYQGRAIEPDIELWIRDMSGGYDWAAATVAVQAITCESKEAGIAAELEAALRMLHWDAGMLSRAWNLRFEDLDREQRKAIEALVPVDKRVGYVWPALEDSQFASRVDIARLDAIVDFEKAHPARAAECKRLLEQAWDRYMWPYSGRSRKP